MNCTKARRRLDLYMDSELSLQENMEVLEHLNLCRACQGIFQAEERLRELLKCEFSKPDSLGALLVRVGRAIRMEAADQTKVRPSLGLQLAVAAAVLVSLAPLAFLAPHREDWQALTAELFARHESMTAEYYANPHVGTIRLGEKVPQVLQEFFHRYVPYDVCVHDFAPLGYVPVGATVWKRRGGWVCWTTDRDSKGHTLSHALLPTALPMVEKHLVLTKDGRTMVAIPQGTRDLTCAFVFDDETDAHLFLRMMGLAPK
jgi:hypothetical protein